MDGRQCYDRWAAYAAPYRVVDRLSRPIRRLAVDRLALSGGETVLDVGCGPGGSFGLLAGAVGPAGRVVGVDYSRGMVRRARAERTPVVDVVRADAAALPLSDGGVDAALASLSLSAMPAARTALGEVRRALAPGGRLAVVDGRLPDGAVERVLGPVYRRLVNWQGHDVVALLREAFPTVEVVETFDAGLGVVAVAEPEA